MTLFFWKDFFDEFLKSFFFERAFSRILVFHFFLALSASRLTSVHLYSVVYMDGSLDCARMIVRQNTDG